MNVYEGKNIRNVGIVGHGGSGKTSLVSAILFDTGATNRLGRVDDGNAPTDYDEDEIERKITISAKFAFCEWNKNKINILDTPGFGNFIQEARGALRVADAAIVVGVMATTFLYPTSFVRLVAAFVLLVFAIDLLFDRRRSVRPLYRAVFGRGPAG